MLRSLYRVYRKLFYWLLTSVVALSTLSVMVLLPNLDVIRAVLGSDSVDVGFKVSFFFSLYGSLGTNYTLPSAVSVLLISVLFGVSVALVVYYIRRARGLGVVRTTGGATVSGAVAAMFGIGCAACGSALVVVLLKLFGIAWLVSYLPLHGAEFGFLGVLFLCLTIYSLLRRINDPLVCEV